MKDLMTNKGGIAKDYRGQIRFANDFDMTLIKRFYIIKNSDIDLVRGWRGHRIEQRWFYVLSGSFSIYFVKIDNWQLPNTNLVVREKRLSDSNMEVLNVPAGYGTAFRALEPDSELLVFSDYPISHAFLDDYTWPLEYFSKFAKFLK